MAATVAPRAPDPPTSIRQVPAWSKWTGARNRRPSASTGISKAAPDGVATQARGPSSWSSSPPSTAREPGDTRRGKGSRSARRSEASSTAQASCSSTTTPIPRWVAPRKWAAAATASGREPTPAASRTAAGDGSVTPASPSAARSAAEERGCGSPREAERASARAACTSASDSAGTVRCGSAARTFARVAASSGESAGATDDAGA